MKIGFVGMGKLGREVSEVMSEYYDVTGYDVVKVNTTVKMSDTLEGAVHGKDIIFIAVPTPHHEDYDGRYPTSHLRPKDFDYSIVCNVVKKIVLQVNDGSLIALISTLLPGTVRRDIAPLLSRGKFIYNPYFIAQGTVKYDMRNPEMVILGTDSGEKNEEYYKMCKFYEPIVENKARNICCTWEEGEAIKVFYNTFITMKICYANMIQDVAESMGHMDSDVVTNAIAESTMRIMSPRYMKGGLGDGGGCHPRDNIALRHLSQQLNLGYDLFSFLMATREAQAQNMASILATHGKDVVIIGKGFKPGVDQEEGSPSILLGYFIEQMGLKVYYNEAPHDEPCTYLIFHKIPTDRFTFNKNSIIVDPCRSKPELRADLTYIPYGK